MVRTVDAEVLAGFIAELRGYLPNIRQHLEEFHSRPDQGDAIQEAYRLVHNIHGSSLMVGQTALGDISGWLEEVVNQLATAQRQPDDAVRGFTEGTLAIIDAYLAGLEAGNLAEQPLRDAVATEYRKICQISPPPPPEPLVAAPAEQVPAELREVFLLEAEEHLRAMSTHLPALKQEPDNRSLIQEVRRSAHTLKGAADMVGFRSITQLAHRMEDLLDQLYEGSRPVTADIIQILLEATDALDDLAHGKAAPLDYLYQRFAVLLGKAAKPAAPPADAPAPEPARPRRTVDSVRVPIRLLDDLVKLVSELVITGSTFEQRMSEFQQLLNEMQPSADRLKRVSYRLETQYEAVALAGNWAPAAPNNGHANGHDPIPPANRLPLAFRVHGFDDLELDRYTEFHLLSRELGETTNDIQTVAGELGHVIGDFDGYLNRQARLSSEIEDKLMRLRMVPLSTLSGRLQRTVRTVAQQQGKPIDLVIEGEQTELDKTVLEQMADPLLHLLRNAAGHGIEAPTERAARGKPATGIIRLSAGQEGNQIVIQVSDDGGGIDPALVRACAVQRGMVAADQAELLSGTELTDLIFLPGFSTASTVSELAGRGVGLDIVKSQVQRLKGSITVRSALGQGAAFTIRLPLTLTITRALLVRAHQERLAIPLDAVVSISRLQPGDMETVGEETVVRLGGSVYPVLYLGKLLALKQPPEAVDRPPVIVLNAGGRQVALVVDRLIGGREIVVKSLGSHLRQVRGIAGATLLGDGSVVLIVNPVDLTGEEGPLSWPPRRPAEPIRQGDDEVLSIMVVDDSPSVRRIMANLIRRAGWTPLTAKDGVEALEILHHSIRPPNLILLDLEMPRMDGYELLTTLRGQEAFRQVPVVVVTSRAGEKHRTKAMDLGASDYVIKPYHDASLLQRIRELVIQARQGALV